MITAEHAEELLTAATPGPWRCWNGWGPTSDGRMAFERLGPPDGSAVVSQHSDDYGPSSVDLYATRGDAELIAFAPDLAQTVIDLSTQIAEARRALRFMDVAGVQTALGGAE